MPDGGISYLARDSVRAWWLMRLDPATRAMTRVAPMLEGVTQYAWLRDGRAIAARADSMFVLRPGLTARWTAVASFDRAGTRQISRIAISDDGTRIAFVSGSESDRITAFVDSLARAELENAPAAALTIGVVKGADTLVWKGYGFADLENEVRATTETVYRIGSITKQFTSSAIMRLVEKGTISLDDPITKHLPDFPLQGHDVRMRHLLNHTSGIRSYTGIGPVFWQKSRLDLTDEELIALFENEPFDFAPGEKYAYNNSAYYLLGVILTKLGARAYGDYMAETMFEPLGLHHTLYCHEKEIVPHRARGYAFEDGRLWNAAPISMNPPGAAGALCSTIGDLVTWTSLLASGRVVTPASYQAMTTPGTLNGGGKLGYGYGLGVGDLAGHRRIAHSGGINGFVAQLARYPADDLTIVVLANAESARAGTIETLIARKVLALPPAVERR
jgi:CubicO group peptidase (beta-lactamase class C family)